MREPEGAVSDACYELQVHESADVGFAVFEELVGLGLVVVLEEEVCSGVECHEHERANCHSPVMHPVTRPSMPQVDNLEPQQVRHVLHVPLELEHRKRQEKVVLFEEHLRSDLIHGADPVHDSTDDVHEHDEDEV